MLSVQKVENKKNISNISESIFGCYKWPPVLVTYTYGFESYTKVANGVLFNNNKWD
jgi:hypothetical protein